MYSKIVIPLDGSQLAEQALPQVEGLAEAFGSELHLVHVISPYAELGGMLASGVAGADTSDLGIDLAQRLVEFQRTKGQEYLQSLESRFQGSDFDVHI